MRRYIRPFATVVVALVALFLLTRTVDIRAAIADLHQASGAWVGAALASHTLNVTMKGLRWRLLIGEEGRGQPLGRVVGWIMVGQGINNLTPVRLGEVTRATLAGQAGISRSASFGSIFLEKFIEMVIYGAGLLLASLALPLPAWVTAQLTGSNVLVVALLLLLFLTGGVWLLNRLPAYSGRGARLLNEMRYWRENLALLQARGGLIQLGGKTLVIWLTALFTNYALLRAYDIHVPLGTSVLLLVSLQGGLALPFVGMTLGPFEAICVFVLSLFSVDPTRALSFALVLHGIVLLPAVGGIMLMARYHISPQRLREWLLATP